MRKCDTRSFETEEMDDKRSVKNIELISKYLHELLFEPMDTEIELYNSWFNWQSNCDICWGTLSFSLGTIILE